MPENFSMIKDSAMINIAQILYKAVRKHAPFQSIKDSVYIGRVEGTAKGGRIIEVRINTNEDTGGAPFARAFDTGSGLQGKNHSKYPIVPIRKKYLMFSSTLGIHGGSVIKVPLVMHPGVYGFHYTKKAIDEVKSNGSLRKTLQDEASENIKLYLRTQFKDLGTK